MGRNLRSILFSIIVLIGPEGWADDSSNYFEVGPGWGDFAIEEAFGMERAALSTATSFLTYEGPFGFISDFTYRVIDSVNVEAYENIGRECRSAHGKDIWSAIECAAEKSHLMAADDERASGWCRLFAEGFRIAANSMHYWQLSVDKKALVFEGGLHHVLNTFRITTKDGGYEYVIDVGNFPDQIFPDNPKARNFHIVYPQKYPDAEYMPIKIPNPNFHL